MAASNVEDVKCYLQTIHVCPRCILRFLGIKEYTAFSSKSTISEAFQKMSTNAENSQNGFEMTLSSEDLSIPPPKRPSPSKCVACLGILQESCDELLFETQQSIDKSGHEFQDFVLQLSFPAVIDLRDKLLFEHIKEKFSDSYFISLADIPSVKEVSKWVIGSSLGIATQKKFTPFSDFQICISANYPDTDKECLPLLQKCPEAFPNSRKKAPSENTYNRTSILKSMELISSELKDLFQLPPSIPAALVTFKIECQHSPIYLGGRYNKYSRELPQTPWMINGERRMESSVNEYITDVVQKWIKCDKIVFSASGREDVDVKMLGNGRPFVLEILNPRKSLWEADYLKEVENAINQSTSLISVRYLKVITKDDTQILKEGEEEKRKSYTALCIVKKILSNSDLIKLESITDLKLLQKTPIRVLHRRTLATREKIIHSIKGEILSNHNLKIKVETQAGTYVKEFVHGDFGRTIPSLGTLLDTEADVLELDVESIELDWPPETT